tara:strand:+ start:118 stop:435 length:318 start_codon:yes stop_codon:yes gene_type:complete
MSWKDSIRKQDKRKVTEETFRDWKEREEARGRRAKKRMGQREDPDSPVAIQREKTYQEREEAREFLLEDLENVMAELETLDIDNMNADEMKELSKALGKVSVLLQ